MGSSGSTRAVQQDEADAGWRFSIPPSDQTIRFLSPRGPEDSQPHLRQQISVLVWNLQKQNANGFAEAFTQLASSRDLLLLQEMRLRDGAAGLFLGDREHKYTLATSFEYVKDRSPCGVAIGCAVQPLKHECQITQDLEPIVGTPKASLLAEFALPTGQTLLVATVHAINRAPHAAFTTQIDRLVSALSVHAGPILLAGDFNTQTKSKFEYLESAALSLGLLPVQFDTDLRTVSKLSRQPLDHAFVRGVTVQNEACWPGGSDHAAMTFELFVT